MKTISNRKFNLTQKPTLFSENKPQQLQTLTIDELDVIAGAGLRVNHNETIQKPKALSEKKPKESQKLTITELDGIVGSGIHLNHNETIFSLI